MSLGPKVVTTGGGPAKPFAGDFTNWLQSNTMDSGGFNTAINRLLSGQGLSDNTNRAYDEAYNSAYGASKNVGLDPNSSFAQGVNQMLQNRMNTDIADMRARFGAQGGMSMGTPASTAEARYRAEGAPQIAATLGQYDLQKRGIDLNTLINLMQSQSQRGQFNNQMGGQMIGQLLGQSGQLAGMGIPQAQTAVQPGFLQQIGGFLQGAGAIAAPFTAGLSSIFGGGANAALGAVSPAPILMPQTMGNPNGPVPLRRF